MPLSRIFCSCSQPQWPNPDAKPPELAADLVRHQAVIDNGVSAQAAKAATATIPVIAVTVSDPVVTVLFAEVYESG